MRYHKNTRAGSLAEYAIVLTLVAIALTAMQTYIKRGLQGKTKDVTDVFIGGEQVGKILKRDVGSISHTGSRTSSTTHLIGELDGEFASELDQLDDFAANSTSIDGSGVQGYRGVISAEEGGSIAPIQPPPTSEPPTS